MLRLCCVDSLYNRIKRCGLTPSFISSRLLTTTISLLAHHRRQGCLYILAFGPFRHRFLPDRLTAAKLFQVYDVSAFMAEHPGGEDVLLASAGKDATADFEDAHTESTKELLPQYCIGEVDAGTIRAAELPRSSKKWATKPKAGTTSIWLMALELAAPLLLVVMAFALQSYARNKTG